MSQIKIGLLPLYIKLYDDSTPEVRPRLEAFYASIKTKLEARGYLVETSPFCRLASEFSAAVKGFEAAGAQSIVTLHMAYSPSLESIDALSSTELPIVVLDTTETFDFGPTQIADEIMYNHGIHGVMDMCSMLKRRGKQFAICAGFNEDDKLFVKLDKALRAAAAANALRGMRVGRIGEVFAGMGDFLVEDSKLKSSLGVEVVQGNDLSSYFNATDAQIDAEIAIWKEKYTFDGKADADTLKLSAKNALAVRSWMEANNLDALTVNFLAARAAGCPSVMPFIELCLAMERGKGYAGEGDTLTAAFVAALMKLEAETSFIEIFCPDWKGNSLFLSHMGEMNTALAANKPLLTKADFPYTDAADPATIRGAFKPGKAVYANLTPCACGGYTLFIADVEMVYPGKDEFTGSIRGWLKPDCCLSKFLEEHSYNGASHHSALVYGDRKDELVLFGRFMGFDVKVLAC